MGLAPEPPRAARAARRLTLLRPGTKLAIFGAMRVDTLVLLPFGGLLPGLLLRLAR